MKVINETAIKAANFIRSIYLLIMIGTLLCVVNTADFWDAAVHILVDIYQSSGEQQASGS